MKLSPKVISLVLGILLVSMTLLAIPLYWYTRDALETELGLQLKRINLIISKNIDLELVSMLVNEPGLVSIRHRLEQELARFTVPGIEGLTLYSQEGAILAQDKALNPKFSRISTALPGLLALENDHEGVVSEIYELADGGHIKAAALPLLLDQDTRVILVTWTSVSYMTVIKQMTGSLFWIFLAALLLAVSMTLIFTRSLIIPVRALSDYARAIQSNINSEPIHLGRKDEFGDLNRSLIEMHVEIRKQEESARQLLSGIAHEIKNPLGGMEIYTGLLQEELSSGSNAHDFADHRSYLAKINEELTHLKQIVQEYLDYARPLKSRIETMTISEIHADILSLLKPEMSMHSQTVTLTGTAELQADRSKLHRVFLNLIQNGLQAAGEQGQVNIRVQRLPNLVEIDFSDNGTGIPEADWQHIFQPYFSTRDRGFGLGLTIVQSIVVELGGTIVVQKSDQEGTIFRITLPIRISAR
ncbi:MAG: HAMP domain-containing histidine kinase [Candidatus Marinimicrobia bacterium]|nr:HAMP domain-containing histidine kinase [Candidatus Neomarinimicrobiota bacterium]